MIICSRNIIAHKPYFVVHTAQAYRCSFEEGKKPDVLWYHRSRVQEACVQSACPASSNTTLSHTPLPCVRCVSSGTLLVLQWMLILIPAS